MCPEEEERAEGSAGDAGGSVRVLGE